MHERGEIRRLVSPPCPTVIPPRLAFAQLFWSALLVVIPVMAGKGLVVECVVVEEVVVVVMEKEVAVVVVAVVSAGDGGGRGGWWWWWGFT
jgi:hypothetical protein